MNKLLRKGNEAFDHWLLETCGGDDLSPTNREQRLIEWQQAPAERYCHPREEHLLPCTFATASLVLVRCAPGLDSIRNSWEKSDKFPVAVVCCKNGGFYVNH